MKNNFDNLLITNIHKISTTIALGLLLVGCDAHSNYQSQAIEISQDIDINQVTFDVWQKIINLGKQSGQIIENLDRDDSLDPLSFQELLECLPKAPSGWSTEQPQGQTNSFGDYSVSQVKQTYFNRDQQMTVSIFDWAFNSAFYLPFLLSTEFSQESTAGYSKGINIDDIPGRETYDYNTKDGSLNLLINRRFLVEISGNNIEESELRDWWELIDRNTLKTN